MTSRAATLTAVDNMAQNRPLRRLQACKIMLVIISTLSIHHSFTLLLQAENLPFQQILPTLIDLVPSGLPSQII